MAIIIGRLGSGTTDPAPSIKCWIPEQNPSGTGIIIIPGGGYNMLAEHEGKGYAERFVQAGMACFVVTYRLGSAGFRHPAMLEDALAAIETVRSHAVDFGIDPCRLGVMGSSAGGHLAAHALVAWSHYESDVSLRPDFGILCYPVIIANGRHANHGSIQQLLGETPLSGLRDAVSCERHVSAETPPCFIWHTLEDDVVPMENSLAFASALRAHGIPFELHIYEEGRHGLGLDTPFHWEADCLRWLTENFRSGRHEVPDRGSERPDSAQCMQK